MTGQVWIRVSRAHLNDPRVCAAAIAGWRVHPCVFGWCALLPKRALLVLHAPATFEAWICLQAHATALSQSVALIQVSCAYTRQNSSRSYTSSTHPTHWVPSFLLVSCYTARGLQTYLLYCRGCRWQSFRSKPLRDPLAGRWYHFLRNYTAK